MISDFGLRIADYFIQFAIPGTRQPVLPGAGSPQSAIAHAQLHIGPGGLPACAGRAEQEAQGAAGLGSQLKAAERSAIEPIHRSPHGGYCRRTQRLDGCPLLVLHIARAHDDEPIEVDAPGRGGRRIESL